MIGKSDDLTDMREAIIALVLSPSTFFSGSLIPIFMTPKYSYSPVKSSSFEHCTLRIDENKVNPGLFLCLDPSGNIGHIQCCDEIS